MIHIKGEQGIEEEKDSIEFVSEGLFGFRNGCYFLSYDEGHMAEKGEVKTRLTVNSAQRITLERSGDISSRMEIEKGERNNCFYRTPVGELSIGIYGQTVESRLDDSGGTIELVYNIDSGLRLISRNRVHITVKEISG